MNSSLTGLALGGTVLADLEDKLAQAVEAVDAGVQVGTVFLNMLHI